jgi:hypothetical protein
MLRAFPRIRGLDQRFGHVDGDGLGAVADGELVARGHRTTPSKNYHCFALDPREGYGFKV